MCYLIKLEVVLAPSLITWTEKGSKAGYRDQTKGERVLLHHRD